MLPRLVDEGMLPKDRLMVMRYSVNARLCPANDRVDATSPLPCWPGTRYCAS